MAGESPKAKARYPFGSAGFGLRGQDLNYDLPVISYEAASKETLAIVEDF